MLLLHYTQHCYIALHFVTLHPTLSHFITCCNITLHYIQHCYIKFHYIQHCYITLHYIQHGYITLHYIQHCYITLHYSEHCYITLHLFIFVQNFREFDVFSTKLSTGWPHFWKSRKFSNKIRFAGEVENFEWILQISRKVIFCKIAFIKLYIANERLKKIQ